MKLLLLVLLCSTGLKSEDVKHKRTTTGVHITNGINVGKALASALADDNLDMPKKLADMAKKIAPLLGVLGPFVSFVVGFIPKGPTKEYLAIQQLHKDMDTRFDQINGKFHDVSKLIQWNTVRLQFSSVEQTINNAYNRYTNMYKATTSRTIASEMHNFKNYRSTFGDSALTLYNGIMGTNTVFGDELLPASMKFTDYNRKQCARFMEGLLRLLLRAVEMDLAYLQLDSKTAASVPSHTTEWKRRLDSVRGKMLHADATIVSKYHEQSGKDIDRYSTDHPASHMSDHDFANNMYQSLATKYHWRDWMVIAYDDVSGDDKHYQRECGGYLKFRSNGRNIVVASIEKTHSHASSTEAKSIINSVHDNDSVHLHRPHDHVVHRFVDARHAFDTFNSKAKSGCSTYAAAGVVDNKANPSYKAAANRLYLKHAYYHYIHVFG